MKLPWISLEDKESEKRKLKRKPGFKENEQEFARKPRAQVIVNGGQEPVL